MVVMTSLMKLPITWPNNQNVSLVVLQAEKHELCEDKQISMSGSSDFILEGGKHFL